MTHMNTVRYWLADGSTGCTASRSIGGAFDAAVALGAVRIVDAKGEVFRPLFGEWVGIGYESGRKGGGSDA